ncbi:MAG: hypothetical protein QF743_00770 [Candidatus Marinimicrobia bacterium]|nr:hypothetical protein [Candidatus Neomarinimicrobiota bacterium]
MEDLHLVFMLNFWTDQKLVLWNGIVHLNRFYYVVSLRCAVCRRLVPYLEELRGKNRTKDGGLFPFKDL